MFVSENKLLRSFSKETLFLTENCYLNSKKFLNRKGAIQTY